MGLQTEFSRRGAKLDLEAKKQQKTRLPFQEDGF